MIEYKGYAAMVEFDDSVGRLHGRVVNSGAYPIATFEATDVEGIRNEFHRSVDEYLSACKEDGVEPRRPFSGKLNVRLGPDLHQRVARCAAENGISLNSWIVEALEKNVSRKDLYGFLADDQAPLAKSKERELTRKARADRYK